MLLAVYFAALLCAVLGRAQEIDPFSNLRPNNVTGLIYYLYRWTGSYYNGTTTLRIDPQDMMDDTECDTFAKGPVEISFENSLLAIVKSNRYVPDQNEVTFSLSFWDKSLNITPARNNDDGPINDIQTISLNRYTKPSETLPPPWRLNTSHIGGTSYSFSGYRNYTQQQIVGFNYSTCKSSALDEYAGALLNPSKRKSHLDTLNVTALPFVSGRFDNNSASIDIRAVIKSGNKGEDHKEGSFLGGPITISFLGKIDADRSDLLLSSSNDTPVWNSTLGYQRDLMGSTNAGWSVRVGGWTVGAVAIAALAWLL
ncbi:hypothetical protein PLIIFM63780_000068 [Purpureocillium lilacinum]|nr:hypothetical protein PLIIFM63780_000068 [Purpureocillium lilacinum]